MIEREGQTILRSEALPRGLRILLIVSLLGHVGVAAAAVGFGKISFRKSPERPQNFMVTKLVRLGKKREQHLLPRKELPPEPAPAKSVPLTKPDTMPAKSPPSEPKNIERDASSKSRIKELRKMSTALERLRKYSNEPPEGDPNGVAEGTVSDASLAIMGSKVMTEIDRCIRNNYKIEGVDKSKVAGLEATLLIFVRADGSFAKTDLTSRSNVEAFDRAVERAAKQCGRVSPPPKELSERLLNDGVEIVFRI